MKKILILIWLLVVAAVQVQAQTKVVEKTLNLPASNKLNMNLRFANNIKITAWDKKEVSFKASYEINSGKLNDALLITFPTENETARINVDFDKERLKAGKAEDCPESKNRTYQQYSDGQHITTCSNINYEIFVPRNTNLTVETISGDIELRNLAGPVHAKSISGFVDMNWPDKKGAAVSLKTITGEVYSDLNIDFANKKENPIVGYQLKGSLNGGGSDIKLETISNNIYLRKTK